MKEPLYSAELMCPDSDTLHKCSSCDHAFATFTGMLMELSAFRDTYERAHNEMAVTFDRNTDQLQKAINELQYQIDEILEQIE